MIKSMLIAGAGGFLGTCGRFLVSKLMQWMFTSPFPYGTFAVNLIGCLVIGLLCGLAERSHLISPQMNVFLITGFCGGFTTFSSFSNDLYLLTQNKQWLYFGLYLALSIALGIVMVVLGRNWAK